MAFYLLKPDPDYTDVPQVTGWFELIKSREISREQAYRMPERELFYLKGNPYTTFLDILFQPCLLVTDKIKEIITLYEPDTIYKQVALIDRDNSFAELYHLPILHTIDCLTDQSEFNRDRSVIKKAVINLSRIKDRSMFNLAKVNGNHLVGRLDIVESILRTDIQGLNLLPVETV